MKHAWYMPTLKSTYNDHASKMVIVCLSMALYWETDMSMEYSNERRAELLLENIDNAEQYALDIQ